MVLQGGESMTATKDIRGAWVVSGLVDGHLVTRRYYGYTKREAVAMWREEAKAPARD